MSRNLSETHVRAGNARAKDEVWVPLIVIDHPSLDEPLRFTNVGKSIESNGETYSHFPFDIILPDDSEDGHPRARLIIDNTTRAIMATVRSMRPEPTVKISVVLASAPDVVEIELPPLPLRNLSYDVHMIEGEIAAEDYTGEPYPAGRFTPSGFPGMF